MCFVKQSHAVITQDQKRSASPGDTGQSNEVSEMKFQDLPKNAQHHALSTLRDLITAGCRKESEMELAGLVKAAFVSMYAESGEKEVILAVDRDVKRSTSPKAITPRPCDGVSRVYHDTMVKALRIQITELEERLNSTSTY